MEKNQLLLEIQRFIGSISLQARRSAGYRQPVLKGATRRQIGYGGRIGLWKKHGAAFDSYG